MAINTDFVKTVFKGSNSYFTLVTVNAKSYGVILLCYL